MINEEIGILESIISILVGLTVIISFFNLRNSRKRKSKHNVKVIDAKLEIKKIIEEAKNNHKGRKVIPALAKITNAGSKLSAEGELYIQAIDSIDNSVMNLWGNDKTHVGEAIMMGLRSMFVLDYGKAMIKDISLRKVQMWANKENMKTVNYFLIGHKGKASYAFVINDEWEKEMAGEEKIMNIGYAAKIKKLINDNKKWYQKHIR